MISTFAFFFFFLTHQLTGFLNGTGAAGGIPQATGNTFVSDSNFSNVFGNSNEPQGKQPTVKPIRRVDDRDWF